MSRQAYLAALTKGHVLRISGEISTERLREYWNDLDAFLKRPETHGGETFVVVTSAGGEAHAGFALYDELRSLGGNVKLHTLAQGAVCSAAINPLLAAPRERRFAAPTVRFFLHEPSLKLKTEFSGHVDQHHPEELERQAHFANSTALTKMQYELLERETGQSRGTLEKLLRETHSIGAAEALELGIIGGIFDA